MWSEFIVGVGGSALLLAAAGWLTKSIISHFLSKDVENYKLALKATTDLRIEEFRSSLRMRAYEHEVRFSRLHERRAEIVAELYSKLADAVNATADFVSIIEWLGAPSKEHKYRIAMEKIVEFFSYFDSKRIFLSAELCLQIENFVDKIRDPAIEFSEYMNDTRQDPELGKEKRVVWSKVWKSVTREDVPQARKALETEFRNILGVECSANTEST